jgi:hypothetical protein
MQLHPAYFCRAQNFRHLARVDLRIQVQIVTDMPSGSVGVVQRQTWRNILISTLQSDEMSLKDVTVLIY